MFVFFHSQAIDIAEPKVKLRGGVPLFGGFPVPVKGLVVVLRGADAVGISPSQVELGCNVAQFRRLLVAVEGFLLVFRYPATLFVVDCQLEQRLGVSFQSYLLKGFYVDGIGGDGVFLLAVVVGSVIHFTGNRTGEHWDNFCSPELVRSPILHISPIRIKTRFYWGRSSESFTRPARLRRDRARNEPPRNRIPAPGSGILRSPSGAVKLCISPRRMPVSPASS